jgi:hypothetical protein
MHGVKKVDYSTLSDEKKREKRKKIESYIALKNTVMDIVGDVFSALPRHSCSCNRAHDLPALIVAVFSACSDRKEISVPKP